jgi:uncharacterized Zn finger protein
MSRYGWRPYVPVALRRERTLKKMAKLRKKGLDVQPVEITGRKITRTFWGEAWCNHLESFSDYENRLPRGRTYARNGSVCHLDITQGEVHAMVSGSALYQVEISIETLDLKKWKIVKERCAGQIGSLLELLQGKLSESVMRVVTDQNQGLFPVTREISLSCSCPDWAVMCKHIAAVLYGVGARLDARPELLFLLRGVEHEELISTQVGVTTQGAEETPSRRRIADDALGDLFGIDLQKGEAKPPKDKSGAKKSRPSEKVGVRKAVQPASSTCRVTGKAVARLRTKFKMSRSQFARLVDVSAASISNWEKKYGELNLQPRTLNAWKIVQEMTKHQSWKKLKGS